MPTTIELKSEAASLAPGGLATSDGSPFAVSTAEWRAVNDFVIAINSTDPGTTAEFTSLVPAYADLRKSSAAWPSQTLPNLIRLSQDIYQHGAVTVPNVYPKLEAMLQKWETSSPSAADQQDFQLLLKTVQNSARTNASAAMAIVPDLRSLMTAIEVTNQEFPNALASIMAGGFSPSGDPTHLSDAIIAAINQMAANLARLAALLSVLQTPPVEDIERIEGAFTAIANDLDSLQSWVLTQINDKVPVLGELAIESAMQQWQSVASEAQAFAANAGSFSK
jgi:hypothetical protein